MKFFNRTFIILFVFVSVFTFFPSLSFAVGGGQVIDTEIKEQFNTIKDNNSGEVVYIKDYEEYEELMKEFDENTVNKNEYLKQLIGELRELEGAGDIPLYKARVLSISEPETRYTQDQASAQYSMGVYQNGEVEIIDEGVLFGKKLSYMTCLTYDVYGNINLPAIKVGDVVNVALMDIDESSVIAFSPELDTYVRRFPTFLFIAVFVLIVLICFFGKHFAKLAIPLLLMVDLLFGVVGPMILQGYNLWLLVFFAIVLNTIAICVLKLGANAKAIVAIISTVIVSICLIPIHAIFDNLLNFAGLTSESFFMSGGVTPNIISSEVVNILNFHALSVATTLLIAFALVALVACKTAEKYEENKAKLKGGEIISEDVKSYVAEMSFATMAVMIANALPKHMLLLVKSYSPDYILQSEIFLIELLRVLVVLIALVLTVPLTLVISKFLEN